MAGAKKRFFSLRFTPLLWVFLALVGIFILILLFYDRDPHKVTIFLLDIIAIAVFFIASLVHLVIRFLWRLRKKYVQRGSYPKWWRVARIAAPAVFLGALILVLVLAVRRNSHNQALARQARAEAEEWMDTLPTLPDSENGMVLVLEASEEFDNPIPERLRYEEFNLDNESDKAVLEEYLRSKEKALKLVHSGLAHEKLLSPTDYRKGYLRLTPYLLCFKNIAQTLTLEGNLLEHEGKMSEALDEYVNVLKLGRSLSTDRGTIAIMIESALLERGLKSLTRNMNSGSAGEGNLKSLLAALVELHGSGSGLPDLVEAEYFCSLVTMADMIEGNISPASWIPDMLFLGFEGLLWPPSRETHHLWKIALKTKLMKWYLVISLSTYTHDYDRDYEMLKRWRHLSKNLDPHRYYELPPAAKKTNGIREEVFSVVEETQVLFASMTTPHIANVLESLVETEVFWRGTILLTAIRLHESKTGELPENLGVLTRYIPENLLVDPYSGKQFIYYIESDDFYLYSVGVNEVDDKATDEIPYFLGGKHPGTSKDFMIHTPHRNQQEK